MIMRRLNTLIILLFAVLMLTGCYFTEVSKLKISITDHGKYSSIFNLVSIRCENNEHAKIYYTIGDEFSLDNYHEYSPSYYSLNGYNQLGILVRSGNSISAIAISAGSGDSDVCTLKTKESIAKPVITDRGLYISNPGKRIISISCATADSTIRYTTDQTTPGLYSTLYQPSYYSSVSGSSYYGVLVDVGSTVKAIGIKNADKSDAAIINSVDTPSIADKGIYRSDSSKRIVQITSSTYGATIRYTTDGSVPNDSSPVYYPYYYTSVSGVSSYGVLVPADSSVKAVASKTDYIGSGVASFGQRLSVNLNGQWRAITDNSVVYDSSQYDAYESYSNYHKHSSSAEMEITISGYSDFTFKVMSDAESNYDYLEVYDIDSSSQVKMSTRGNQNTWEHVTFSNISSGSHKIRIVYKKDSSDHSGRDRGFVLIPKT